MNEHPSFLGIISNLTIFDPSRSSFQGFFDPFHSAGEVGEDICIGGIVNFESIDVELGWEG